MRVNKLFAGYFVCIFVIAFISTFWLHYLIWYFNVISFHQWDITDKMQIVITTSSMFLFEALPLGVLLYLWLKKGNGLSYFQSWKMGKWSRIIALLLLLGFIIVILQVPIDYILWLNGIDWFFIGGISGYLFTDLFIIGCALMLAGLVALIYLWIRSKHAINFNPA